MIILKRMQNTHHLNSEAGDKKATFVVSIGKQFCMYARMYVYIHIVLKVV